MSSNGVLITLRGGPHNGLEVPASMADPQTGDVVLATVRYPAIRYSQPPTPVTATYRRTATGVATYDRTTAATPPAAQVQSPMPCPQSPECAN